MTTYVSLRIGTSRCMLELTRIPKFLRFVMQGSDWKTLDALDQLTDEPREGERVLAAEWKEAGTVHIDGVRNGRRFGEWRKIVTYELVPEQPAQELLRDTAKWQAWCFEQAKNTEAKKDE